MNKEPNDRAPVERTVMHNAYGAIAIGTNVYFSVENPNMWVGPTKGVLDHDGIDFIIRTEKGVVTINKGYDAYINTIRPVVA